MVVSDTCISYLFFSNLALGCRDTDVETLDVDVGRRNADTRRSKYLRRFAVVARGGVAKKHTHTHARTRMKMCHRSCYVYTVPTCAFCGRRGGCARYISTYLLTMYGGRQPGTAHVHSCHLRNSGGVVKEKGHPSVLVSRLITFQYLQPSIPSIYTHNLDPNHFVFHVVSGWRWEKGKGKKGGLDLNISHPAPCKFMRRSFVRSFVGPEKRSHRNEAQCFFFFFSM